MKTTTTGETEEMQKKMVEQEAIHIHQDIREETVVEQETLGGSSKYNDRGENGTGGLLIIYAGSLNNNNNNITSNGKNGGKGNGRWWLWRRFYKYFL